MSASADPSPDASFLLPDLRGGGAERVAVQLAESLPGRSVDLLLFGDAQAYETSATVLSMHRPIDLARGGRLRKVRELVEAGAALRRERRRRDLGVAVSFLTFPNLLNVVTRARGQRVVLTEHNDLRHNLRGRSGPALERAVRTLYPRADRIIAVSEGIRRDLVGRLGLPPEKVVTVHDPVDLAAVDRGASAPLDPRDAGLFDRPTLIAVGSLSAQKGQWHLLRVLAQLHAAGHDARLLLIGEGPLRATLDAQARTHGLRVAHVDRGDAVNDADVAFLGFVENPHALMARGTLFLLPSLWEGFGLVLVEAMRVGIPVLAADCRSGPREILAPATDPSALARRPERAAHGVLLPPFDAATRGTDEPPTPVERAWVDAIATLLEAPAERAAWVEKGRARAPAFDVGPRAAAWADAIFEEALP